MQERACYFIFFIFAYFKVCKKEPVVEEKSKDFELCHLEPKKVCEEKTFKIPTLHCEEEEEAEE